MVLLRGNLPMELVCIHFLTAPPPSTRMWLLLTLVWSTMGWLKWELHCAKYFPLITDIAGKAEGLLPSL